VLSQQNTVYHISKRKIHWRISARSKKCKAPPEQKTRLSFRREPTSGSLFRARRQPAFFLGRSENRLTHSRENVEQWALKFARSSQYGESFLVVFGLPHPIQQENFPRIVMKMQTLNHISPTFSRE